MPGDIDGVLVEHMMVRACARLVALGRVDQAAALRLGEPATLVLWRRHLRNLPLVQGLLLRHAGWHEDVVVLDSGHAMDIARGAHAARQAFGWQHDGGLTAWLAGMWAEPSMGML